ncbi:MAG: UDP-3-O-acyl-N-acetylglucosamine deacetylase, partial [Thermoanaerobaculia bacterium]
MSDLILIVDDEPGILSTLGGILADEGYDTLTTTSGQEALSLYEAKRPSVVFLDVWLADRDGLETLQALREADPAAAVVMMSGHGTTSTAVKAIKMGAFDYLEKPLSYKRAVDAAAGALDYRKSLQARSRRSAPGRARERERPEAERRLEAPPELPLLADTGRRQRTLRHSTVIYGLGLHSGQRTGMVLQPLPENSGLHFLNLPTGVEIPAHIRAVAETDYATTLSGEGESIKTVEHLLSALHAYGVGNLLIKVNGEIPVLDGSALEFCKIFEEVGIAEQDEPQREVVIDRRYEVGKGEKVLAIEPAERFSVSYLLRYPAPVGEQSYEFTLNSPDVYKAEIAPARTFGFMKDLKML